MNLTQYLYTGPQSAAALRVGAERELLDVQLLPGKPVGLPADHEYTQVLLELRHLVLLSPVPMDPEPKVDSLQIAEKKGVKANGS